MPSEHEQQQRFIAKLKADTEQRQARAAAKLEAQKNSANGYEHFLAYLPDHKYIFRPTGARWPAKSVDNRLPWYGKQSPATWLDRNQAVEQMTWAPGEPTLVKDKLVAEGGWTHFDGATVFNLYRPPDLDLGNPAKAEPWIEHVHKVYPGEAELLIKWFAHRCQYPEIKINHALVLGGAPGIGKDTMLAPVRITAGHWNTQSVSPVELLGSLNGFRKSVILLVSEARDLGDVNRPQFYEHLKTTIAAPPDVLRVNEKHTQEYYIPNVVGVIITTNYKSGGIYLAAEDRRHLVAWSYLELEQFGNGYWDRIWDWYINDFKTRLVPHAAEILIQTRWHDDDLAGRALNHEEWRVISLPALAEPDDPLGRALGEPLWCDDDYGYGNQLIE